MLGWFRRRRRRKLVAGPFPDEWNRVLQRNVPYLERLDEAERATLDDAIRVFIAEKNWEGCNGLELTDEIKVTIAAQACLLLLGFVDEYFGRLQTILVYPGVYVAKESRHLPGGVVSEGRSERLGEAFGGGVVVLSWPDVFEGARDPGDGHNVVLHEFAHVIDMTDADPDGIPPLGDDEARRTWQEVLSTEYAEFVSRSRRPGATLLDRYAATNEAEFFAVATEVFFERPIAMRQRHPRLYDLLRGFYRQDPAARVERRSHSD